MNDVLYYTGLILVIVYILMGFDDFVWDIIILFKTLMGHRGNVELNLEDVDAEPKRLLAVMIAAWHEENVIEDVLNHFIQASIYPKSQFHIFVGVYPNDLPTIEAVKRASLKHHNVHVVINEKEGPTTKAQNLNYVLKQIIKFEQTKGWRFKSFTVHDSEDVIHSFELPYTNYIMTKYKAVQFPVFPLIEYPSLKNFFKNITSNTYADEFAEHHYLTMVYRNSVGAFVPSAGTGFALRRDLIEKFDDYSFLPEDSLTEDYKLAYSLYQKGENLRYVRAEVPYIDQKLKVKTNYVATRSMFPNTFETAVRQKRRWITGITMQSVAFKDIFQRNGLSFVGRYSLYRDQKAKVGNLIAFIGYPVLIYFVVSLFIDLPPIYPKYSLSWYLSLLVTIMMIERLIFRTLSITKVYGFKSAMFSTMFPPLIPIRYVWGNTINFMATLQAYTQRFKKQNKDKKKKVSKNLKWDKTEHHFLSENVLRRFYMRVGDLLLKRGYIEKKTLRKALKQQKETADLNYLGIYLLNKQLIQEKHLLQVLADIDKSVFLEIKDLKPLLSNYFIKKLQFNDYNEIKAIPFFMYGNIILMVQSYDINEKMKVRFELKYPQYEFHWHYGFQSSIKNALTFVENDSVMQQNIIQNQKLNEGFIDEIQFLLALDHSVNKKVSMDEALKVLGLKI